jgi:3-oxoacyl-[acyl-carrier protein] reductase
MSIAVVTGGSSGIGRAVTDRLALTGQPIHVIDRDPQVPPVSRDVTLHQLDVQDASQLTTTLDRLLDSDGPITSLVCCAGIKVNRPVTETTVEEWDLIHEVNLRAVFLAVRSVLPGMTKSGTGSIVTVGSPSGYGDPGSAMYASAKAGIIGFSKSVALSLAGTGVRINTVVPAFTRSGMTKSATEERIADRGRSTASGTVNEPEDVADAITFLLSSAARNISGAVLEVGRTQGEPALQWTPSHPNELTQRKN